MREIFRDDLTGCYNRRYLHYWTDNEIKRCRRFSTTFVLMLLDIDDFRNVNNRFGHLEGDRVLVRFAEFLHENVREVDSVVRYGGDEFIVLMPNSTADGASELGHRMIDALNGTKLRDHRIRCSIGFAVFPEDGAKAENLVDHADGLMYQAKKEGKNRICVRREATRRLRIPSPVTVGRDGEIGWCLSRIKASETIFVAGPAGVGKTRLVMETKDRMNTQIMLRGNAYAALSSVPFHPFKNMFTELMNRDFSFVQQTIRGMPEVYQAELMKLLPPIGMQHAPPAEELDKYRLYHATSEFLERLAGAVYPATAILFIDDLHWADRSSFELLDFLMRSARHNLKVFATCRSEEKKNSPIAEYFSRWAEERLYAEIVLSPLNEAQTAQLLDAIMGAAPETFGRYVYRESGGNPFFIEEMLAAYQRARKLYWDGRDWIFVKGKEFSMPASIEETVKRKLALLDAESRSFLELAAVFGQEFTPEFLALASKRNAGQVLEILDDLGAANCIKIRSSDTYYFSEDVAREVVYQNLKRAKATTFHNAIAEAIEIFYHDSIYEHLEELARHFALARNAQKTLQYAKQAAVKARDHYAQRLAVEFYESALKYEDRVDQIFEINHSLADIHMTAGNYRKALAHLQTCRKLDPHAHRVYERIGSVYEKMGQYKRSLGWYERGMRLVRGTAGIHLFKIAIAWLYTRMGQYLQARKECADLLKKKKTLSRHALADVHVILGVVMMRLGKFNEAEQYFRQGLKIRRSIGDKKNIAACYVDLGLNFQGKFNITMGERFFNRALAIYQEVGYQEGILITLNNLGVMYANYDLSKAEAYCLEALAKAKLIGAKRTIVLLYNNLGMISHNRLMAEQSLEYFRRSLRLARKIDFYEGMIFASISLSEIFREQGRIATGKSHLKRAWCVASAVNVKFLNVDCVMEEVEYCLRARQYRRAQGLVQGMTRQLRRESNVLYRIYNFMYRARLRAAARDHKRAQALFSQAAGYVRGLPANNLSGEIAYQRGLAYTKAGRPKEASLMFLEADRIFRSIGNLRYLDRIVRAAAGQQPTS